jgi:hypothetical protein
MMHPDEASTYNDRIFDDGSSSSSSSPPTTHDMNDQQHHHHQQQQQQHFQARASISTTTSVSCEDEWREHCLRGILSYPPGTPRLLIMDAMRAELVERLSWSLQRADEILETYEECRRREREKEWRRSHDGSRHDDDKDGSSSSFSSTTAVTSSLMDFEDDPYLDADVEILRAFERETAALGEDRQNTGDGTVEGDPPMALTEDTRQAMLIISNNGTMETRNVDNATEANGDPPTTMDGVTSSSGGPSHEGHGVLTEPPAEIVDDAQKTVRVVRDYLPQLVSVVLQSPPAFDPNLINPVNKLRQVILRRCVEDANWGVDICWLLEAEVGRAWKALFEHRQQTGRRLILVLPADRAVVLNKIGAERKEAFEMLQDAEQATAFGYMVPLDEDLYYHGPHYHHPHQNSDHPARLPSSLSLRRCSHFGDTMHFIDRLTKISLDLRRLPVIHRNAYLYENLKESNRRIRRRMVTRGDVSLDVEDHRGPDDWPQITDITTEMLRYSVHLPLDPKVRGGDCCLFGTRLPFVSSFAL